MHTSRLPALLAVAAAGSLPPAAPVAAQTNNPFPDPIPVGIGVPIVDYARVATGARLNLLAPDPLGRLFANDQRGDLYRVVPGAAASPVYLDLAAQPGIDLRTSSGEQGFQSFAFHPEFATAGAAGFGRFYTVHSDDDRSPTPDFVPNSGNAFHSVLLEWTAADPLADTFSGTSRELMRIRQPFGNHNAGQLSFNPEATAGDADFGKLYLGLGDGGSGGDPQDLAQDRDNVFGSILRIDPLGTNAANGKYGIPADNPFVGEADVKDEIFAYGLRNPQRFSFDAVTGNAFIADIGQGAVEEINLLRAGGNYGWNEREGSFVFLNNSGVGGSARGDGLYDDPIAEYDHQGAFVLAERNGEAVTVGPVVRDPSIPGLAGRLLLGDFPSGSIFYLDASGTLPDGGQAPLQELLLVNEAGETKRLIDLINDAGVPATQRADLRFGYGADGEVFVLNKRDGVIRQLVPEPSTAAAIGTLGLLMASRRRRRR
ncbi:PQQ-dependent sugar dehydrogenase [Phycisphaera mikurensis]|uniref:Glucose/Sorbosone dehydrogenase domain-containing protein n=1 Tax=Phycisphaera mikurensis (strain NBRC 102666 / KCTC 22515 / FYK2301M01) TaxID=1142394 RepID=I0IH61_PHYMF|nr:PQQ-dependent sugar dehydrogenase [Phycisphaera mikurensis]MBB6440851.1 hypothetical protein [Phycisphaera mikurensis]BAM04599.1 hypothetical protein PSMK_24400 [Phycisphaera mikurensis NBRC 102666]